MNAKQSKQLTWLAGILLVLVGALAIFEAPEDTPGGDEGDEDWSRAFDDAEADAATALTIQADPATIALALTDGTWSLSQPMAAPAETSAVEGALRTFTEIEIGAPFDGAKPEDFGLDTPRLVAEATLPEGRVLRLEVGDDAPVGGSSYVRVSDSADPSLDGTGIRASRWKVGSSLSVDADAYRSKEVVRFATSAATAVTYSRGGQDLAQLAKDSSGWWLAVTGGRERADEAMVNALLDALNDLRVDDFDAPTVAGEGPSMAPEGAASFVVRTGEGDGAETHTVLLREQSDGRLIIEGPLQATPVLVLSESLTETLRRPTFAWLSTAFMPVHSHTIDRVRATLGGTTLDAQRDANGWTDGRAEALLAALGEVRVDRTVPVPMPNNAARGVIELIEGETRTETVEIFQEVEGGRVVADRAGGAPFLLPTTEMRRLSDAIPGE